LQLVFQLWKEQHGLNPTALSGQCMTKLSLADTPEEKEKYLSLLYFLYSCGVSRDERVEAETKAALIKAGETSLVALDRRAIASEIDTDLVRLSAEGDSVSEIWRYKSYKIAAKLMQLPTETATMELILDAATLFSRSKAILPEVSYTLLFYIFEQTKNPALKKFFSSLEPDYWENYLAIMLKTMSRFLHDAVMEYIIYYELPPGASNKFHLEACQKFTGIAIRCCYLVHRASGLVETELDRKIYQFCSDAILNKDPKPLVTYSYRLVDLSSEDFFITLPKDILNKYMIDAIDAITQK
jgi:hypothetical protein